MAEDRMLSDEVLLALINKNSGGGGGGTSNYNDLSNKPQIGGNTLVGNKTASDLGLVAAENGKGLSSNDYTNEDKAIVGGVTAALAGKQGVLTAGNYVSITNDGTINVTQGIGVYDVYSYELMSTGVGITIQLTKKINNVTISTQDIRNEDYSPTNKLTVDGLFELWYDMSNFYWHYKLLVDSEEHQKNEDINWYYRTMADYTETFDVSQDSSTDLATKGDVDTALADKQDKTDNSLQTTNKTVVGAINEHEGDIDSLKSGLNNQTARSRSNITSRLTNLTTAVAEQNLEKYGYKIGDYFTGASGYTYHLADMDTFYGGYNNNAIVNTHHISLVVNTGANSKWAETNDTSGGYKTSTLHSFLSSTVLDNIKSDMIALFGGSTGLEHLVSYKLLWTTATSGAWAWSDNAEYISALSEPQVYGTNVWAIDGYQTGEAWKWLEIFHKFNFCEIIGNIWWWLRSISSSSRACNAVGSGSAGDNGVSVSGMAVGLIIFH